MPSDSNYACIFCSRYKEEGYNSCLNCERQFYKDEESGVQYPLQKPLLRVGIDMLNIMAHKNSTREEIENAARTLEELINPYVQ